MEHMGWTQNTWTKNTRPGFRLKRLEVTNWGTFDSTAGEVYSLNIDGRTALLVGQNGSGKSTLVDALLTLLVQPGVRNYNVAAGAKKRERDERTYIRGACGRSSDDELGSVTDYLRPHDKHYSVVLAVFERAATGEAFTIAQVLQILGDGEVDKTYAFAENERSIAGDLSGLSRSEKIRKQLMSRGFKATTKYSEYYPWFARHTGMRAKAMDVFNQTVAVKDIQSLNRFIRDHMLEARPWRDKIDSLLNHFSQLSQAHQTLVKARRQIELLEPIESATGKLQKLTTEMTLYQQQLDATDSFFRQQVCDWLQPRLTGNSDAVKHAQTRKAALEREIAELDDAQRQLKNEIEKTGGERLRQLPHQLETQHALLSGKMRERNRLNAALKSAGLDYAINDEANFARLPSELKRVQQSLAEQSSQIAAQRLELARELTHVRGELEEERSQLELLRQQPGNLPGWLADLRGRIATAIGLRDEDLPFACELISVADDAYEWQAAIETVLRRFSLTMLVPEEHYRAVSQYVDANRLVDSRGRGQKLVYVRIAGVESGAREEKLHDDSLVHKVRVRADHTLAGWLMAELKRRFDFRCCETLEQFQRARGYAITQQRHVKYGPHQHEKDDRAQASTNKHFVLGWDNAARLTELHQSLQNWQKKETETLDAIHALETESKRVSSRLAAVEFGLAADDFAAIDCGLHEAAIAKLESERHAIEESNDAVRLLRESLEHAIERRFAAQKERDGQVAAESNLLRESDHAEGLLERHQAVLMQRKQDGSLMEHTAMYADLEQSMASALESVKDVSDFSELQTESTQQLQRSLNGLSTKAEPIRAEIIRAMQRFLSDSPEQRDDLRADMLYSDGFLGLLEQLRRDDLPKYERRFQDRLNEKVIQEIGVFHAALQCERQEITAKIAVLNASLEQLEYQAGTFMRLKPREVSDREIRDFQLLLRDCLSDQFDGDASADESRFSKIEKLISRLREEERWRDKVTDVRRWFDFSARELDAISGQELSCYEDSAGQSGGEKAKLAFTILVAAIAYQFNIDPADADDDRFHFVVVDEMFSKVDDRYAEYALQLFEKFGLQILIVAPLDAKARVTEPYVGCYLHTVKNQKTRISEVITMTANEYSAALSLRSQSGPAKRSRARAVTSGSEIDTVAVLAEQEVADAESMRALKSSKPK